MNNTTLKIGARGSRLSIIQSQNAIQDIQRILPEFQAELIPYSSPGDQNLTLDLRESPADFFSRDLDQAVLNGEIDAAIHSAKDLPYPCAEGLDWFWLPFNEDARDVIVLQKNRTFEHLPPQPVIGISSERRDAYCRQRFPQAIFKPIRGTIEHRLQQLDDGHYDLLIMAAAALHRLNLTERVSEYISLQDLPPPDGQGFLAVTFRKNDQRFLHLRQRFVKTVTFAGGGIGEHAISTAALEALKHCDVCLYDDLLDTSIFNQCPPTIRFISVGKRSGAHRMKQTEITALIAELARQGKRLVRLKGGDPGIFGRLSEEIEALTDLQLPFRVLPGIPALCTATTGTGLLLTRRNESRGFCVMTPDPTASEISILPEPISKQPLVLFMSIGKCKAICQDLSRQYPESTPTAAVFNAGMGDELILEGTLATIDKIINQHFGNYTAEVSPPGLLIIGNYASPKFQKIGLLTQQRIWLTCSSILQEKGRQKILDYNGRVIEKSLIQLQSVPTQHLESQLLQAGYLIISSPGTIRFLMQELHRLSLDIRQLPPIICCGNGTKEELAKHHLKPMFMPEHDFSTKGMTKLILQNIPLTAKLLRLRSDIAGTHLTTTLQQAGYQLEECILYKTADAPIEQFPQCDVIFFASSSAVHSAVRQFGTAPLAQKQLLAIGTPTAETIVKLGLPPPLLSPRATIEDAIDYLATQALKQRL